MSLELKTISKEVLIAQFKEIAARGWIENKRGKNDGAVGNTLEDLLGIPENNLPIPNATEWELKVQRVGTKSLLTLFHQEPSPRTLKLVPEMLLPRFGWAHKSAGKKYPKNELSFRATIHATEFSERGFSVAVNRRERRIEFIFDESKCQPAHENWLKHVLFAQNGGNGIRALSPLPYWGFDELCAKAATKLLNCFYVQAETKKEGQKEFFHYCKVMKLTGFQPGKFINAIESGSVYVDFDARTGHNHGTKFRIRFSEIPSVYESVEQVV